MFIVMGVSFATYVCLSTMTSFLAEPTVITLDPQQQAIWDEPFPSIAVCSKNKLSRNAVKEYSVNMYVYIRNLYNESDHNTIHG